MEEYIKKHQDNSCLSYLEDIDYTIEDDCVVFGLHGSGSKMAFTRKNVEEIVNKKALTGISGLTYYNDCGFSYYKYAEYFISFGDIYGPKWPENDSLYFKIGAVGVAVGLSSSYMSLLLEPYYQESDYGQYNFSSEFASIKLFWVPTGEIDKYVHNVLFYLNSHYLLPFKLSASIYHLFDPKKPPEIYDIDEGPNMDGIVRKRIRSRKSASSIEPLMLFNNATVLSGESQFLEYYRVLEFYFERNYYKKLSLLRVDTKTSNKELINYIKSGNERSLLYELLDSRLNIKSKDDIVYYARKRGLVKSKLFNNFVESLYDYRCSVVHSKESLKDKTLLHSQIYVTESTKSWNYIVKMIATKIIRSMEAL